MPANEVYLKIGGSSGSGKTTSGSTGGVTIPLPFAAPYTLKETRGTDPYFFTVGLTDISKIPPVDSGGNGTPASFLFKTPMATDSSQSIEYESSGWYLVRIEPAKSNSDIHVLTFADERWIAQHKRISLSMNLRWPDGRYREDSLVQGTPYTVGNALTTALQKFGYTPVNKLGRIRAAFLPDNLGNSPSGGWTAASWSELIDPLLYLADCDLVFRNGKATLIEKAGDINLGLADLKLLPKAVDSVGQSINGYERPRKLRVHFDVRMEAAIEKTTSGTTATDGSFFSEPENVMLRYTPTDDTWWALHDGVLPASAWNDINTELATAGFANAFAPAGSSGGAEFLICNNWFLPFLIPPKMASDTGPMLDSREEWLKKQWLDGALRNAWRRYWRVRFPYQGRDQNGDATHNRRLSGLSIGRLDPDGSVRSRGVVYADWAYGNHRSVYFPQVANTQFTAIYSENHPFDADVPAPYSSRFLSETGGDLIFQMDPIQNSRPGFGYTYPFLFERTLRFDDWKDLVNSGLMRMTEQYTAIDPDFKFRLFLVGNLTAPLDGVPSVPPGIEGRQYVVESTLFPEGGIEVIDIKVSQMTANFVYTSDQASLGIGLLKTAFPQELSNDAAINAQVARINSQLADQYAQGEAGGIVVMGVEPASKVGTQDSIHEFSIIVGDPDPWSIKCQYIVAPNIGVLDVEPEERDGKPTTLIDWS